MEEEYFVWCNTVFDDNKKCIDETGMAKYTVNEIPKSKGAYYAKIFRNLPRTKFIVTHFNLTQPLIFDTYDAAIAAAQFI